MSNIHLRIFDLKITFSVEAAVNVWYS